jgi:hypothetical protein
MTLYMDFKNTIGENIVTQVTTVHKSVDISPTILIRILRPNRLERGVLKVLLNTDIQHDTNEFLTILKLLVLFAGEREVKTLIKTRHSVTECNSTTLRRTGFDCVLCT